MVKPRFVIGRRGLLVGLSLVLLAVILIAAHDGGPNFSQWGQAAPVGPPITSIGNYERCPFIAKNDLDLYFRKLVWVPDPVNDWFDDIFVSHRDSVDSDWDDPINLGPNINSNTNEACSFVTIDGHWIYFVSGRADPTSYGGTDIFVSHRVDKRNDTGWETPKNLGPNVNTSAGETGPSIFEDEATGQVFLYFTRPISGKNKIFSCQMLDREIPGPAAPVAELNSAPGYHDLHAFIRRKDGLEVIFASDRESAVAGKYDLFVSTRPTASEKWTTPIRLPFSSDGTEVNSPRSEARPSISWDGTTLYFWTDREWVPTSSTTGYWNYDVYRATRTKVTDKEK